MNTFYDKESMKTGKQQIKIWTSRLLLFFMGLSGCLTSNAQSTEMRPHPRLLMTTEDEIRTKQLMTENPQIAELAHYLKARTDSMTALPQLPYQKDKYGNILHTSRAYVDRLGSFALAYRLYGEQKYLKAANEALLWVCNYPDWDPPHYLDTAEMTTAVAIAYDWLYDALPATTRKLVKETIYKNALSRVLKEYKTGGTGSWAKRETNWNVVCNAGMTLGALAVAEDYPQAADSILRNAARYMPNCLKHFAPDGVCYESPAYWGYTASYLALYLKAVTDNGGDRYGIGQLPGLQHTAEFYRRTVMPSGQRFNYGNAGGDREISPAFFLFSRLYKQPEIAQWYRGEIQQVVHGRKDWHQLFFLSLPWYDTASTDTNTPLPRLQVFHNDINDIIALNGDRNTPGFVSLLAKGGEPMQAHQQLDGGTFIIESDSICWLVDLGSDDYSLPGFWDGKPGGKRWQYFRNNNFSHNTLHIDRQLQHAAGKAFVCEEKADAGHPFAKLDMTSLYKGTAQSVFRTFTLKDACNVEVKDEVKLTEGTHTVTWNAVTEAQVEVKGNQAHLIRNGKHFYMEIVSPAQAVFRTHTAQNTSSLEYPIQGVTVIEAECPSEGPELTVTVRMSSRPFFAIDHGPYLQEVTTDGATFAFSTSAPSFSFIELAEENSDSATTYTADNHGLRAANTTFFGIRAENLKPNTSYRYRIHAKEMKSFQPYKVTFGDSIISPWHTFRTINPKQKGGSIFVTSDMHSNPERLKKLLELCDYRTCTAFFYAGDMMNYMEHGGEHPFTSFIDASVEMFASTIPFEMVRGNHETRGDLARVFPTYFPKRNGKIYGSYQLGDVMVIMLDSGEDKSDMHPVYAGLTNFDSYRTEQAQWLEQVVKSKAFKKARYRIVISHFPPVMSSRWKNEHTWYGWQDACDKFLPILNRAGIDLVISGHTHRYYYHEPDEAGNNFPVLEQGAMCATRIDLKDGHIRIRVTDKEGKELLNKIL